jgi:hypothetical protein
MGKRRVAPGTCALLRRVLVHDSRIIWKLFDLSMLGMFVYRDSVLQFEASDISIDDISSIRIAASRNQAESLVCHISEQPTTRFTRRASVYT